MRIRALSPDQRLDWLRLARTSGVGPVTFAKLIERFDDAAAAIDALPRLARRGGRIDPLRTVIRDDARGELDRLDALGARLLCACEPGYPALLRALEPPPPVLSVLGPLDPDERPACAMVGSRNASAIGVRFAGDMARTLGGHGVTIVSGLARGIDGAAHAAALETGTIAVIAGGLEHIYPPEHEALYRAIGEQGLIVSECPPRYQAGARDFPRRNRLISGLSLGVLVVEAAERSGTLITARYALEQNREVMAVPGSPMDPRARGTNRLLRDGAALVETADDVLNVLHSARRPVLEEPSPPDFEDGADMSAETDAQADRIRDALLSRLSTVPVARDELTRQLGVPAQVVLAALIELELAGRVELLPGAQVCLSWPES